jgi:hypothetical protein
LARSSATKLLAPVKIGVLQIRSKAHCEFCPGYSQPILVSGYRNLFRFSNIFFLNHEDLRYFVQIFVRMVHLLHDSENIFDLSNSPVEIARIRLRSSVHDGQGGTLPSTECRALRASSPIRLARSRSQEAPQVLPLANTMKEALEIPLMNMGVILQMGAASGILDRSDDKLLADFFEEPAMDFFSCSQRGRRNQPLFLAAGAIYSRRAAEESTSAPGLFVTLVLPLCSYQDSTFQSPVLASNYKLNRS